MDNDERDNQQRRHDDANRDQREGAPASVRRIAEEVADRAIKQSWNDVGVDFSSFQGKNEHARLLDYMRERYRDRERIQQATNYAMKMQAKEQEIDEALSIIRNMKKAGETGKKNVWGVVLAAITAAATGAVSAFFATRGGHGP